MKKRLISKINKRAEQNLINDRPLTQMERIAFMRSMDHYMGPEIKSNIKNLFGKGAK